MTSTRPWKTGDLARIEATGQIVELVTCLDRLGPGTSMIHAKQEPNLKVAYGLDRETRQIHLYLLDDLIPAA